MQFLVLRAVFVDELGALHVEATILRDFGQPAFAPPSNRIETVARFADAETRAGDGVEAKAVAEFFLDIHEQIERAALVRKVEDGVGHEHFVVEIDHVESDDEVGADELLDEFVGAFFGVDAVFAKACAVGDAEAHAHVALFVPAAHVVGGALGFEVEINDIWRHYARVVP